MNVISIHRHRRNDDIPLIALIDLQKDYFGEGRLSRIQHPDVAIRNAATLLAFARRINLPIAHFRFRPRRKTLSARTDATGWIAGFEPYRNEHVFDRAYPSCLANETFEKMLASIRHPQVIFAGICAQEGCLATAVDLHNRGYNGAFVKDCSASMALDGLGRQESIDVVYQLIRQYANVTSLDAVLEIERGRGQASSQFQS